MQNYKHSALNEMHMSMAILTFFLNSLCVQIRIRPEEKHKE